MFSQVAFAIPSLVTVSPTSGLVTSEAGTSTFFNVVLDTQPNADVNVPLSSSDATEGSLSLSSLTFTPSTWDQAQTVTITGVDDGVLDGSISYTIQTGTVTSSDSNFHDFNPADVDVLNIDNEGVGFTVNPIRGLVTEEGGTSSTFTMVLNTPPTANLTVPLSSSDSGEGIVSPSSLTFTPSTWDQAQTVTITGVDDDVADGAVAYVIETGVATSSDNNYQGLDPTDVHVTNHDNEVLGMTLTTSHLTLSEPSSSGEFGATLISKPSANVTIPLTLADTSECTLSQNSLIFSPTNWNVTQIVTVTALDDSEVDGNQICNVRTGDSIGGGYADLNFADVAVKVLDDEMSQLPTLVINDVIITEVDVANTVNAHFTVTLTPAQTTPVTVKFYTADKTALAGEDYQTQTGSVTFAPGETTQSITVETLGDGVMDEGNETFWVILNEAKGAVIDDPKGLGIIRDNDGTPAFSIDDISVNEGDTGTVEMIFTIALSPASTNQTSITYETADNNATAGADYTAVTATTLTFSPNQTSKQIKVLVASDSDQEEDESLFINLTNASGGAVISDDQGKGNIVDDDVNDGISAAVEDDAPNSGDGDNDGKPDSQQLETASRPSAVNPAQYITAKVSNGAGGGTCQAILDVTATNPESIGQVDSAVSEFPGGLLSFVLSCQEATVKLYYHGITSIDGLIVRKYANSGWLTVPNAVLATEQINGKTVATARFFLQDNDAGDTCPEVGKICDPVGIAVKRVSVSTGTGGSTTPEIELLGNGLNIVNGDNLPRITDYTQFPDTMMEETSLRSFTIRNTGNGALKVTSIRITGQHESDFSVATIPSATIGANQSSVFQVTFKPTAEGSRNAIVMIDNSDSDEASFQFTIQGKGLSQETSTGTGNNTPDTTTQNDSDGDGIPDIIEAQVGTNPLVKDNNILGNHRLFVMQMYRNFLLREGDAPGVADWVALLDKQDINRNVVVTGFLESQEVAYRMTPVIRLYFGYFKRLPDLVGLQYWVNSMHSGSNLSTVSDKFATSKEFQETYGELDESSFVQRVYQNVLGRTADVEGLNHWITQLQQNDISRGQLMAEFSESAEYQSLTKYAAEVILLYVGLLDRMPESSGLSYWVEHLDKGGSLTAIIQQFLSLPELSARYVE